MKKTHELAVAEYVQEEGSRHAQIFRSSQITQVIVMCMDGEDVIEDHICEDLMTAELIAAEWVEYGKREEETS